MIETNMLPISVVEGEGLKELVQYLKPEYVMPSRATVTKCIHYQLMGVGLSKARLTETDNPSRK